MSQKNVNILKKIKLVITGVDGVLTYERMYYSNKGKIMKKLGQILT
jgi:3-deoxy-D-manno-octulosonate 8-phosphate phosphatase KdsC-like HAD superfamily phosphatase